MDEEYDENVNFLNITTTLGSALLAWSHCEEAAEHILRDLLVFHNLEKGAANTVAATADLRTRCALSVALSYKLELPGALLDEVNSALNRVQNDIRNKRNRIFHDSWMMNNNILVKRTSTGPKIRKPQSHATELYEPDYDPAKLSDVRDFTDECMASSKELHALLGRITDFWAERQRERLRGQHLRPRRGLIHRILRGDGKP